MELRNYANECYMRVRRNDLRKDIENGYISHEQANQYLAEYAYELKYPDKKPDKTVIQFITDAITSVDRKNSDDVLYDFFHAGYCYYFALMLKEAFGRGRSAGVHLTGISAGRMRMALAMILVEFVIRNAISTYQCLILKKDFWISFIFLEKYLTHRKNISIMQ